jgi:hypothetical protein
MASTKIGPARSCCSERSESSERKMEVDIMMHSNGAGLAYEKAFGVTSSYRKPL